MGATHDNPTAVLCVMLLLAGCATGSGEQTSDDAEYREAERRILQDEFRRQCLAQGGYVVKEATNRSRISRASERSSRIECATKRRGSIIG